MPLCVDRAETLRRIVEDVLTRTLVPLQELDPDARAGIEQRATRDGLTLEAAHAIARNHARAGIRSIEADRAIAAIADEVLARAREERATRIPYAIIP